MVSARLFPCNVLRVLTVVLTVSVPIWKTQDRMCRVGHPDQSQDGIRRLYDEVISADSELKQIMQNIPTFFSGNCHEQN